MLVDMHLHECTYSTDSFLHLEEIVSIARQKGLDAICITDHDSMGLRERAEAYSREIGYPIFVGVEFFSLWGDITAWGIDGIPDQRVSAQDFIDLVREKGCRRSGNGSCAVCRWFVGEHPPDCHVCGALSRSASCSSPQKVMTGLPDCSTVAAVNASQSIYGFVFCLHWECENPKKAGLPCF